MKDYQLAAILDTVVWVTETVLAAVVRGDLIEGPLNNIHAAASELRVRDEADKQSHTLAERLEAIKEGRG